MLEVLGDELAKAFTDLGPVLKDVVGLLPGLMTAVLPLIPILGELAGIFFKIISTVLPVFVELQMCFCRRLMLYCLYL